MGEASKVVLVTGASSGFGRSIAAVLAARGHHVFGTSRDPRDGESGVTMLELDVTRDESVEACVAAVMTSEGRVDVLVNNAGIGLAGAVEDTTLEEARWQMETNFFGPVRMIRAVLPGMRSQGKGRIITVGSMAGHAALAFQPYYSSSKFALEALNEALRLELRGSGIDSTIVCPGDFRTGFTSARVFAAGARSGRNASQLATTVGVYERDETHGADPRLLADLVARLVDEPRLRVRYFVGRLDQRIGIHLKRLLPAAVFERFMRGIYKLP